MFVNIFKMKIEIIVILFYTEKFTNILLELSTYFLDLLFNYFMNALLYTDEIVSQKYHNNGKLDLIVSISISLISNIISSIIIYIIKFFTFYNQYFILLVKEIKSKDNYFLTFNKLYKLVKVKVMIYYIFSFILSIIITYYIILFSLIYKKSQISLLINYIIGLIESLIFCILYSFIICILRFIGLKYKLKLVYRISVYLFENL